MLVSMQANGMVRQRGFFSIANLVSSLGNVGRNIKEIVIIVTKNTKHHFQLAQNSATIIANLKHCGKEEVFSTVTTNGFFTVNGVVVSNCDAIRYALYMQEGKTTHTQAFTHYPSSTMPRHNLTPFQTMQGLPPELQDKPKVAHTFYQHL